MILVIFGWSVLGTLIGFAIVQSVYVWLHCRFLHSQPDATLDPSYEPRVAVILCVRGTDPSLDRCLTGLARQTYPRFELHVVADNKSDPGLNTVREFTSQPDSPPITTHILENHPTTSSLKCSAIVKAIFSLDATVDVVAFIDADTVADPNWIRDLVQPLADPSVGVTTGNRWFSPPRNNLAGQIRQAWNAAAVCQMTCYRIPWGGSLAMRRSTIERCDLLNHWSTAFCEDTMLTGILKSNGLRTVRIPSMVIANDESTTMRGTYHWIVRQLITVRLYHRDWPLVFLHGTFLAACMVAVFVAIGLLFANGEPLLASLILATWVVFEVLYAALFKWIRSSTRQAIESRGGELNTDNSSDAGMVSFLATQLLYAVAVIDAAVRTHVSWRGIDYRIGPSNSVRLLAYHPYRESIDVEQEPHQETSSLG